MFIIHLTLSPSLSQFVINCTGSIKTTDSLCSARYWSIITRHISASVIIYRLSGSSDKTAAPCYLACYNQHYFPPVNIFKTSSFIRPDENWKQRSAVVFKSVLMIMKECMLSLDWFCKQIVDNLRHVIVWTIIQRTILKYKWIWLKTMLPARIRHKRWISNLSSLMKITFSRHKNVS